jgi:hypothetical protein
MTDFHGFVFGGCRSRQKPAANGKLGKIFCEAFIGSQETDLLDVIGMELFFHLHIRDRSNFPMASLKRLPCSKKKPRGHSLAVLGGELKEVEFYPRQTLISLETPSNGNRRHRSVSIYSDSPRELRSETFFCSPLGLTRGRSPLAAPRLPGALQIF